jgi:hypothetical protein
MGKSGSVYTDVDVPDFSDATECRTCAQRDAAAACGPKNGLPDLLPVIPTSERHFRRMRRSPPSASPPGGNKAVPVTPAVRIVDAASATSSRQDLHRPGRLAGRLADTGSICPSRHCRRPCPAHRGPAVAFEPREHQPRHFRPFRVR